MAHVDTAHDRSFRPPPGAQPVPMRERPPRARPSRMQQTATVTGEGGLTLDDLTALVEHLTHAGNTTPGTARVKVTHHDDQRDGSSWEVTVTW